MAETDEQAKQVIKNDHPMKQTNLVQAGIVFSGINSSFLDHVDSKPGSQKLTDNKGLNRLRIPPDEAMNADLGTPCGRKPTLHYSIRCSGFGFVPDGAMLKEEEVITDLENR